MLAIVLWLGALASLLAVPSTATTCSAPWNAVTSNPLTHSDGSIITSSPNNMVSAVTRSIGGGDGLDVMAQDATGASQIGDYAGSGSAWTTYPGWTGDVFHDFHWLNYNSTRRGLFYITGSTLAVVFYNPQTNQWSGQRAIRGNVLRFPRAVLVDGIVVAAVQMTDMTISVGYSDDGMETFKNEGIVNVPGSSKQVKPAGQYTLFSGTVDGAPAVWIYFAYTLADLPYVAYATSYTSNNLNISSPKFVGDYPLHNTTSVTAIANTALGQAMLVRTGFVQPDSPTSFAYYTIIKMVSGSVQEKCEEDLILSSSLAIDSVWAPALTYNALGSASDGKVTLTWVNNNPGANGYLMTWYATPWM